jgi:hypothetical protein
MGEDQHQDKSPAVDPDALGAQSETGDAFDVWLQRSLHQLYDGVTQEPIPAELLRLLEQDRARKK